MELWKPIPGHDGYEASNYGSIRSLDRTILDGRTTHGVKNIKGRVLKQGIDKFGYFKVFVSGKTMLSHRLIASAFCNDFESNKEVNHKDGKKNNNKIDNLEMVSRSQNAVHMYENYLCSKQKSVASYKNGNLVAKYKSTKDAGRHGFDSSSISRAANGIYRQHKGYEWKFI